MHFTAVSLQEWFSEKGTQQVLGYILWNRKYTNVENGVHLSVIHNFEYDLNKKSNLLNYKIIRYKLVKIDQIRKTINNI